MLLGFQFLLAYSCVPWFNVHWKQKLIHFQSCCWMLRGNPHVSLALSFEVSCGFFPLSLLLAWSFLLTKVCLIKAMVFPMVMYGCESWTMKTAEGRRIDAFELCVGEDS